MNHNEKVKYLKRCILQASYTTQKGYLASSFSIMDILVVLYDKVMRINGSDLKDTTNDRLVLSKGHAAFGLYAVLADKGYFDIEELNTFGQYGSRLGLMPDRNKAPGIEFSTGSLGHGLPCAIGTALGCKIKRMPNRVFVIVGDGELNEGTMWESILIVPQLALNNICCIVDDNLSSLPSINYDDLEMKFRAFRWDAITVDGHNAEELYKAFSMNSGKPTVIIAKTIKGRGCRLMEENPQLWHSKYPTTHELEMMMEELH